MSNRKEIRDLIVFDCKGVTPKYVKHSSTIVLNQKCIKEFKLDYSLAQFISQEQKISEEKYLKVGDILINSTGQGTAGRCAIVSYIPDGYKVTVDSHMLIIRCSDINTAYILAYNIYLNESYIMKLLTGSSGQAELDKVRLYNINIPIPKNKKTFKDFLVLIQNKIENNNKINEELESMAKTIYDYWFLQFEFPNEEGNPYKSSGGKMVWNEELKREIPEGWKCGNIGCLFESQAGYAFKSKDWKISGHPVLTIKAIDDMGNINFKDSCYIDNDFDKKLLKYAVKNGNMVFAMSGNTIGKVGIIASNIDNILINQRVLIIKTKPASIAYPYFILKDSRVRNLIEQLGRNSAQPNISEEQLRNIKTIIPQNLILKKYNEICSFYFEKKIKNQIENQELEQLRDFILPLLMNGQIEFRELELAEG